MRRINDWAKRLVLCFLSFVMVFSLDIETVFAADKEEKEFVLCNQIRRRCL